MSFDRLPREIRETLRLLCSRSQLVTPGEVLGRSQHKFVVDIRRELARGLRQRGLSYPEIGRYLDRHHTAVMHLCAGMPRGQRVRGEIPCPDESGIWNM